MGLITRLFSNAATGPSSVPLLPTQMTNAQATALGLKIYQHGTTYNNGIAPTVGGVVSVQQGQFIPYQMQDGSWRMKFNVGYTQASSTTYDFTINGVEFITPGQAVSVNFNGGASTLSYSMTNTSGNTIILRGSANLTQPSVSGDVRLASKPTWAY